MFTLACTHAQQGRCSHFSHQPLVAVPPPLPTVAKAFARAVATTVVTCCETAVASACELPPAQQQSAEKCGLFAAPSCATALMISQDLSGATEGCSYAYTWVQKHQKGLLAQSCLPQCHRHQMHSTLALTCHAQSSDAEP